MNHDKEKYQDELTLFSLGLLKGDKKKMIEEHLDTGCEVCLQLVQENERVVSSLAYSLDDSPIDPRVEAEIFDKIDARDFKPVRTPKSSFWSNIRPIWLNLGSAVAVGLLIFLFVNNMSMRNELSNRKQDVAELRASLKEDSGMMDFFTDPDVKTVELASAMTNMDSSAKLMWNEGNSDALLLVSNMPALKAGMEYQVWCMEDGKPVSVGTFTVNKDGKSMMEIDFMPKPSKDMPEPTGATYLVGSL
jgi:anti-sigma-K factor RskA